MSDVLSAEEVNALLKGVSSGEVDTSSAVSIAPEDVREFDLSAREWISCDRMPSVDFVNQLFARHFQIDMRSQLHDLSEVTAVETRLEKYDAYVLSLERPTSLNVINVPQFDRQILFVLNADLILNYVDFYFGGGGVIKQHNELTRDFTATEMGVSHRLLELAFKDLATAWKGITPLEFEYLSNESNPEFANFYSPSESMVISRFNIQLEEKSVGWLDIVIPHAVLEPMRKLLDAGDQGDQIQNQKKWTSALEAQLQQTEVVLSSILTTTKVSLGDLLRLRVGDIVPVELPATVELVAQTVPIFSGTFGISNGHNSIRIIERLG